MPSRVVHWLALATVALCSIIHSPTERHACPHYQQIGCLSDTLEKACLSDEELSFTMKTEVESVWMCCCPRPYQACSREERSKTCDDAMFKHMAAVEGSENRVQIQKAIQATRGDLVQSSEQCTRAFAPAKPISVCGSDMGLARSIGRVDLFCETVTWQWEELGDGNPDEFRANKCPVPTTPMAHASGAKRKGARLSPNQVPHDEGWEEREP